MPGPTELVILLVLAVFLFGPKRLPEIGSAVGKGIRGFKDAQREPEEDQDEKRKQDEADRDKAAREKTVSGS
ncbi:MAG: twin-arginine translocase TatA/TatE family subunit [Armatimonadetes bacterium]|nr:twin-arginine translocase TatA/TatE family subunit [Armatimonadota bacterium]